MKRPLPPLKPAENSAADNHGAAKATPYAPSTAVRRAWLQPRCGLNQQCTVIVNSLSANALVWTFHIETVNWKLLARPTLEVCGMI